MDKAINFQELFNGFQNTPLLWNASAIYAFEQFNPEYTSEQFLQKSEYKKLRLGKWVENFVAFQLQQDASVKILEENLQIKNDKLTIGELDMLILKDEQPIHLEIIYKFYLYDTTKIHPNAINNWIGPNRNDALIYKLKKLKEKQLPLLYHAKTIELLKQHQIDINLYKQHVCFKAQLFLPYENQTIDVAPLNPACVVGWYLNILKINELKNHQFYIPEKLEWLCLPRESVEWLTFGDAKNEIQQYIATKRAPLCWIKNENRELQKCFITWW